MLRRRLVTAAVLIPPLVAGLYALDTTHLAWAFAWIAAAAAWEWARLAGSRGRTVRLLYAALVGAAAASMTVPALQTPAIVTGLLWWTLALLLLVRFEDRGRVPVGAVQWGGGFAVLIPVCAGLLFLHARDPATPLTVLYLLVLVWLTDTAAFFAGRRWGRTPLAPQISPGKTVAGFAASLAAAGVLAAATAPLLDYRGSRALAWVLLALSVTAAGAAGDLLESMLKRQAGVKDSGTWLPGHGGILDRIDSLTAAAPTFAAGWWLLQRLP